MSDTLLRYRALETYLCDLQGPARRYCYSWVLGLSVLLLIQGTLVLTADAALEAERAARASYLIGTLMTAFGLALVALTGRPETNSCAVLRRLRGDTEQAREARLHEGERRLARAATAARRQTSLWLHVVGVLLGLAVGLGLGFGYRDNLLRALLQGVGTCAFMELRIWTRPKRAIEYADRYAQRYLGAPGTVLPTNPRGSPPTAQRLARSESQ